ncbi:hypothetical protein MY11210_001327 [Beauveria gryllotalpidicola]
MGRRFDGGDRRAPHGHRTWFDNEWSRRPGLGPARLRKIEEEDPAWVGVDVGFCKLSVQECVKSVAEQTNKEWDMKVNCSGDLYEEYRKDSNWR